MIINKKAQYKAVAGSSAGALIGLITVLIIAYLLIIPASERQKLLDEETQTITDENILLQESIGRLSKSSDDKNTHTISNMYLKEVTESSVLYTANSFIIKKGISEQYKTIEFFIEDPENTKNTMISFNLQSRSGTLKIILNGHSIFEGEINTESPQPIQINKNYLEQKNKLEIQVHGFGVPAKIYAFENFKIIADITNAQKQESSHLISISETEYSNIEHAYIDFMPYCNQNTVGVLELYLNSNMLFSGIPNCNSLARINLDSSDLMIGSNEIKFRLLKGTINLEQIRLKTILKTQKTWSNYFYVSEKQYNNIQNNQAILEIQFSDDGYLKEAELELNNEPDIINQNSPYFTRDISSIIQKGNNYLFIKPDSDLNILNLEIKIE